jgi:hypothetical protein
LRKESHDDLVEPREKDLGPQTPATVKRLTRYDPDTTWKRVAEPN